VIAQTHWTRCYGDTVPFDASFWRGLEGYSGANIRDAIELSQALESDPQGALEFIIPAAKQDPKSLEALRSMAMGRFLSSSYAGPYAGPKVGTVASATRKIGG